MTNERNKKYSSFLSRNTRYLNSDIKRANYINIPKNHISVKPKLESNQEKTNKMIYTANNRQAVFSPSKKRLPRQQLPFSDFPMPAKKGIKMPKIKVKLTYGKIMLGLGLFLAITLSANLVLYYNYQKNHPAMAKAVLRDDAGKGIEIDDYSNYDKTPITFDIVDSYQTKGDTPELLQIQKININARIKTVSSDSAGSIKVPKNIHDVGWYEGSSRPSDRKIVFLDGTTKLDNTQGVFASIAQLGEGDDILIVTGNGSEHKYRIKKTKIIENSDFNILTSIDPPEIRGQGLSITTNYGPENNLFKQRYIILAEKQP